MGCWWHWGIETADISTSDSVTDVEIELTCQKLPKLRHFRLYFRVTTGHPNAAVKSCDGIASLRRPQHYHPLGCGSNVNWGEVSIFSRKWHSKNSSKKFQGSPKVWGNHLTVGRNCWNIKWHLQVVHFSRVWSTRSLFINFLNLNTRCCSLKPVIFRKRPDRFIILQILQANLVKPQTLNLMKLKTLRSYLVFCVS